MEKYFLSQLRKADSGVSVKKILSSVYTLLIGNYKDFSSEHQFFNLTCLFTIAGFSSFIVVNIVFEINYIHTLIKLFVVITSFIFYYYSRIKLKYSWPSMLYFLMVLFSLLFIGVLNGGVTGGIAPIYISILVLMLFVMSGTKRIVLLAIWTLSISSLFLLEYYQPELITPYLTVQQKYVDLFLSYFTNIVIVAFIVVNIKRFYKNEKKERETIQELVEKYRSSGFELKEIINKKIAALSLRERELCKLLIEGKSNREIADEFFIGIGTVKSHLNNIYKKLGTNNRVEVINLVGKNLTFL